MSRTKYGYAESSNLKATQAGFIYNIKNSDLAIENGTLWKKGDLVSGEREVYAVTRPVIGDKVVLALSSLYAYDEATTLGQHEMYLRKEAGEVARAYELVLDDRYAISSLMITAIDDADDAVAAGNLLVVDPATGKYVEMASDADVSTYGFVAKIENVVAKSNMTLVELRVIKNEGIATVAEETEPVSEG